MELKLWLKTHFRIYSKDGMIFGNSTNLYIFLLMYS